jgi:IS5 family transposase
MTITERIEKALETLDACTRHANQAAIKHAEAWDAGEFAHQALDKKISELLLGGTIQGKNERERNALLDELTRQERTEVAAFDSLQRGTRLAVEIAERDLSLAKTRVKVLHALLLQEVTP